MRHHELSPGPASRPFPLGDAFIFDPSIVLFRDVTEAVTLELWIEDLDGNVVQVDAPGGGKRPAKCSWSISKVKLSPLFVEVITG
ncbi:MAG TPA: hypothetical protein VMU84_20350 [Thermoanaerobaculia bacterium]|nr:hypothetical protein [Thermoanaerobaculia bacterium]